MTNLYLSLARPTNIVIHKVKPDLTTLTFSDTVFVGDSTRNVTCKNEC